MLVNEKYFTTIYKNLFLKKGLIGNYFSPNKAHSFTGSTEMVLKYVQI